MSRLTPILLLVLLVTSAVPSPARHLSVGASDTVLATDVETPQDPSVSRELHDRGTRADCPERGPVPERDPEGARAWCGLLRYHAGTVWETLAPADQRLHPAVQTFDVRLAHFVGTYGLETCLPWCADGSTMAAYRGVSGLAGLHGLTDGDPRDGGRQSYASEVRAGHALSILARETRAWEADGWMFPAADQTFVAFLAGPDGLPMGPSELVDLVAGEEGLPYRALPRVCGFTPAPGPSPPAARPGCEVPFRWTGRDASPSSPCRSPAYACGTMAETWQAEVVCGAVHGRCRAPAPAEHVPSEVSPNVAGSLPRTDGPADSTRRPVVWHFVVAPTPSACGGHREPGFATAPAATYPYLAHDLDVYTTVDAPAPVRPTGSLAWATTRVPPTAGDLVEDSLRPLWRFPEAEPNTRETFAGVGDTSGDRPVDRDWHDCRRITPPAETPDTLDPWVDVLDARLEREHARDLIDGKLSLQGGNAGRANVGSHVPVGHVGYFADVDDDGRREPVDWSEQFRDPSRSGAYPVLWDMRARADGEPDEAAGCRLRGDLLETEVRLTEAMAEAGYRARTGLVQAWALEDPVTWHHRPTGARYAFPEGGVFVLASQALHVQADEEVVREVVDGAARAAAEAAGVDEAPVVLHEEIDGGVPGSDFQDQCGEVSGGFTSAWSLTRACPETGGCRNAAAVTRAILDLGEPTSAFLDGAAWAQSFPVDHREVFEPGVQVWSDVDLLDAGADRSFFGG